MEDNPVTWIDIDNVKLWERNPNEGDLGAILMSIKRFGYNEVVGVWRGELRGGNHRIKALRQLKKSGWQPNGNSKQLRVNGDDWQVTAFDISHMSELEADAFGQALNRTTRLGMDDPQALADLLAEINNATDMVLEDIGYSGDDLDELLRGAFIPDDAIQSEPIIKSEVVIVIYCGYDFLRDNKNILDEWGAIDGIEVDIS